MIIDLIVRLVYFKKRKTMTEQITLNIKGNSLWKALKPKVLCSLGLSSQKGGGIRIKSKLKKLKLLTKRNILLIKHTEDGFFSSSSIDRGTLNQVTKEVQKFKGKPFDLILHTPGGDPFSSLFISRIIKNYPKQVRAVVPLYAMSGGTILALSCEKILMGENACLGPVDPQLGNLLSYGSAKNWEKILKFKGKKTEDDSINMAYTGKQYSKSIKKYMDKIIDFGLTKQKKKEFIDFITSGKVEHAFPLIVDDLKNYGFLIEEIPKKQVEMIMEIVTSKHGEGVTGV